MTTTTVPQSVPWVLSDIRTLFLLGAGGLLAIGASWWGASGTAGLETQVTWTIVSILGVVALGVGNFFWLLAGRRAVGVRRAEVLEEVGAHLGLDVAPDSGAPDDTVVTAATAYVVVPGTDRFHLAECLLVAGKAVTSPAELDMGSFRPCEMCRP